jgi:hypothetical protein
MAIKIGLVVGTGSVTVQRATGKIANYASDNLKYDINGLVINFYQLEPYVWIGVETVTLLENAAGTAIGIESVVRTYLDAFVGASKAL